jgi:hypothetical protein
MPLHKRFLYARVTSYRFQPAQSFGLLRADATFVTQWKAYAINTSLICTTG